MPGRVGLKSSTMVSKYQLLFTFGTFISLHILMNSLAYKYYFFSHN